MPLYMDHHYIEGVLWDDINFALEKDLELQGDFDATMLTHWFDEGRRAITKPTHTPAE